MLKPYVLLLIAGLVAPVLGWSQQDEAVLFTVDEIPVYQSEFEYIYTKTKWQTSDLLS